MTTTGVRIPRIFVCTRGTCGLIFGRRMVSLVAKCPRCETIAYDREFDPNRENLDWYSAKKALWYKYPGMHEEDIRKRNGKEDFPDKIPV